MTQKQPNENKFHKGSGQDGKHYKPNSLQAQTGKTDIMVEKVFIHPNSIDWLYAK